MRKLNEFIWETHGIHAGTEQDHVKHGIDKLEDIVDKAIEANNPSLFILHQKVCLMMALKKRLKNY